MQPKKLLRRSIGALRDALPQDRRRAWSAIICDRVIALPHYRSARVVHSYLPIGSEVDVRGVIAHALGDGKRVAAPLFVKGSYATEAFAVMSLQSAAFEQGDWGLSVPRDMRLVPLEEIDLLIVPLLAFYPDPAPPADGRIQRLGYGIGFYDTLLDRVRPDAARIGVAFSAQRAGPWPLDPHDRTLDLVITEA